MTSQTVNSSSVEEPAYFVQNQQSVCPWLFVVDHASAHIPGRFSQLGLTARDLGRHIAYDIGALEVASQVSKSLDATLIHCGVSRLVIDCNRPLQVASLIPEQGDEGPIPGNAQLSDRDRQQRIDAFWTPYHDAIERVITARIALGIETRYVAAHSMTNALRGHVRTMDGAVLYRGTSTLGPRLAQYWTDRHQLTIAHNQPYQLTDETDYSVPFHAERRDLDYIELEMRQDLIHTASGQHRWAQLLLDGLAALTN